MRKKLKKRFINKVKRKGIALEDCLLVARLSDSLEEMKEMRRLTKVKNRHKISYRGPYEWYGWDMYEISVKHSGRILGSTTHLPNWATVSSL